MEGHARALQRALEQFRAAARCRTAVVGSSIPATLRAKGGFISTTLGRLARWAPMRAASVCHSAKRRARAGKRARRWRRTDHPGFRRRGHFEIADKIANGVPLASGLMLGFGSAALVANLICLALLWCFRCGNVNMLSMFECSRSDVASNVGVLAAAELVGLTGLAWPNIIGGLIAVIFLRSAWRLLRESWPAWRATKAPAREFLQ
ncbi:MULTISPECIES: cation transporter [Novosphingobium]|uniref:cation transporter n=1 Tax=Novosphingobium TaxID=165696 RepID=UPI0015C77C47|nr:MULTISPECIES: cation transporter [Novosphingobium]